jgi:8-oxo-dGTP pyrophosphatase MutT (NUDIX family)
MVNHVGIVLYDHKNRILLHHKDDKSRIWNPNAWAFFGGGVEGNELFKEAVIRETK